MNICLLYLGNLGLLCPLILFLPPPQKGRVVLDPRQKNVELKSETGALGKEYRKVRHILDEQRSAYTADENYSGLSKASLLCRSDLGRQAKCEPRGAEKNPQKCWLKGQPDMRIHRGQRKDCSRLLALCMQPSHGISGPGWHSAAPPGSATRTLPARVLSPFVSFCS